jgi:NDP-sugar pyrophosphorylase family protein
MKAMILAAGEGTRLRPLTAALPKPMIPIVGVPLLERTLTWLSTQGITEAAINLYHRPQRIPDYFGEHFAGLRLHYFFEDSLRGTAGGVKAAESLFQEAPFFVIYGDNLIQADLRRLAEFHRSHSGIGTISLFHHPNPTAAGIVGLASDGQITRFVEKPPANQIFSDLANSGVYVLDPIVLQHILSDTPSDFGRDIFPALLAQKLPLYGTLLGGYLQDTGTPDAYRQANFDLLAGRVGVQFAHPNLWIAPSAKIGSGVLFIGHNVVDAGVEIGAGAVIADSILLPGARVSPGANICDAIVGDGYTIVLNPSFQEPKTL